MGIADGEHEDRSLGGATDISTIVGGAGHLRLS
jgi:hypothetical protein